MDTTQLKAERRQQIGELQTIVDRAKSAKRDLTAAEKTQSAEKINRVKAIDARLGDIDKNQRETDQLVDFLERAEAKSAGPQYANTKSGLKRSTRREQSPLAKAISDSLANRLDINYATGVNERRFMDSNGYDHEPGSTSGINNQLNGVRKVPTAQRGDGGVLAILPDTGTRIVPLLEQAVVGENEYKFYRMTERDDLAAGFVPKGETKPTGDFGYEAVKDEVRTIAVLSGPVPRQDLADIPNLLMDIGSELAHRVMRRLDAGILTGKEGDGEKDATFDGFLHTPGIESVEYAKNPLATLRTAITQLETVGVSPDAIVMHPSTWQEVELATDANDRPIMPAVYNDMTEPRLFGVPVTVSDLIDPDSAVVGRFQSALLTVREDMEVSWSDGGDLFATNTIRLRAELRAGFNVPQPDNFRIAKLADEGSE